MAYIFWRTTMDGNNAGDSMKTKHRTAENWEKEFDKKFSYDFVTIKLGYAPETTSKVWHDLKDFIRSQLKKAREETIKQIRRDIAKYEAPYAYGSASGDVIKSAVLRYLDALSKKS